MWCLEPGMAGQGNKHGPVIGKARGPVYLVHSEPLLYTRSFGPQSFSPQGNPGARDPHIHLTEEKNMT